MLVNEPREPVSRLFIQGGYVLDPSSGRAEHSDLYIEDGRIASAPSVPPSGARIVKAKGLWVVPGLIDVHVHLREPGEEHKETLETGLRAAAAGGFTTVVAMPNTKPAIDQVAHLQMVLCRSPRSGVRLHQASALTFEREGKRLVDMAAMLEAGAWVFTDDGNGLQDAGLMTQALEFTKRHRSIIAQHCEDPVLSAGGVINDGDVSRRLGLRGWPAAAEETMLERDVALVEKTAGRYHAQHVSTVGSAEILRRSGSRGILISSEVTPHHLYLTEEQISSLGSAAKVNPPLRTSSDVRALRKALASGLIDMVATDHAPHTLADKTADIQRAAFGIPGLETAVPVMLDLVRLGDLSPLRMVEAMSTAPARCFGLTGGSLAPGDPGDVTLIDPASPFVVDPSLFESKARITPFEGMRFPGRAVMSIVGGVVVFEG